VLAIEADFTPLPVRHRLFMAASVHLSLSLISWVILRDFDSLCCNKINIFYKTLCHKNHNQSISAKCLLASCCQSQWAKPAIQTAFELAQPDHGFWSLLTMRPKQDRRTLPP
jgi:hypothetical protein